MNITGKQAVMSISIVTALVTGVATISGALGAGVEAVVTHYGDRHYAKTDIVQQVASNGKTAPSVASRVERIERRQLRSMIDNYMREYCAAQTPGEREARKAVLERARADYEETFSESATPVRCD